MNVCLVTVTLAALDLNLVIRTRGSALVIRTLSLQTRGRVEGVLLDSITSREPVNLVTVTLGALSLCSATALASVPVSPRYRPSNVTNVNPAIITSSREVATTVTVMSGV